LARDQRVSEEVARRAQERLDLADWRRRVGDLYRVQASDTLAEFRRRRDALFRTHPQSPVPAGERAAFAGLRYFDPDPRYRLTCRLEDQGFDEQVIEIDTGGDDGVIRYRRAGRLSFRLHDQDCTLSVLSLIGYGGGLFLPFRDATSGKETYGGGRYLFDTVKNTDGLCLEITPGSPDVTIDFNYAYHPSCVFDPRWACPLAPRENWLPVAIRAGERTYRL
jgi:uncharacterized protein (DUF1684 family)